MGSRGRREYKNVYAGTLLDIARRAKERAALHSTLEDDPGEVDGLLDFHTSSSGAVVLLDGERHDVDVGDYFIIHDRSPGGVPRKVIGLVSAVERLVEGNRQVLHAHVSYLGVITPDGVVSYRTAPVPGAYVTIATRDELNTAYSREGVEWITVGHVLTRGGFAGAGGEGSEVPMCINVNRMCTRHLAVLASTGAGKSNAVAVIVEELSKLGATVVIFDEHGEYTDGVNTVADGVPITIKIPIARFFLGGADESALWCSRVMEHLLGLDAGGAEIMRSMFTQVWDDLRSEIMSATSAEGRSSVLGAVGINDPESFWDKVVEKLEALFADSNDQRTRERVNSLKMRIYDAKRTYSRYMDVEGSRTLQEEIVAGRVNVVVLDAPDRVVDFVLESFVRDALRYRRMAVEGKLQVRSAFSAPVLLVLEEAHKYFPKTGGTGYPRTGWYLRTFAKEARKFGLGMILVSQRPQSIAQDVLTQCGTKILMRMNDEADVRYVKNACDTLSEEVARYVMKFEPGECIVTGIAVPMTLIGRFRMSETKVKGQDVDIVGQWREGRALLESMLGGSGKDTVSPAAEGNEVKNSGDNEEIEIEFEDVDEIEF